MLRHGQSEANVAGIIVSDPAAGVTRYGLTEAGTRQVKQSVAGSGLSAQTIIFTSDFRRASESAALAARVLGAAAPHADVRLRERFFGEFEGQPDSRYEAIWQADQRDPNQTESRVESVAAVAARTLALLRELEEKYQGETILLVAHGDTLNILEVAFRGNALTSHHDHPLAPGELRQLA